MTKRSTADGICTDGVTRPSTQAGDSAELLTVARWQAAEARLYPLIMVDADLYEAAVTLVGEAAGVLRARCDTIRGLIETDAIDVLTACPSATGVTALGFDPHTAFDAARAGSWREITAKDSSTGHGFRSGGQR
jgi:hypothetical protein